MLLKNYNRNWEVVLKKKNELTISQEILNCPGGNRPTTAFLVNPILLSGVRKKVEQSLQVGIYRTIQ